MFDLEKIDIKLQDNKNIRNQILQVEDLIKTLPDKNVFYGDSDLCPLKHTFSNGIYVRQMKIPQGVLLTGKIHKHEHPWFLLKGKITVVDEENGVQKLEAPYTTISKAGAKRVIYAVEDSILTTVHLNPDNIKDIKKLEEINIAKSYEEFDEINKIENK